MPKLKLPRLPVDPAGEELPAALRWEAEAERSLGVLLGRRQFLKALVVLLAALAAPLGGVRRAAARARGRFFTRPERATLEALCDRIIPSDQDPGASALGAARYIEGMLTALDRSVPRIFAGGPFSNRNPFPDNDAGTPSRRRPRNSFKRFVKLSRVQELRWRAELFGSASRPGETDFNDAALGPLIGLREVYRSGLAKVDEVATAVAGDRFASLPPEAQDRVFGMLGGAFRPYPRRGGARFPDLVVMHTLEGCFSLPEYGGNRGLGGWRMIGLEGDDQPLGYSIFSRRQDGYNERPDHPMSTPDPDELSAPRPISADGRFIQDLIVQLSSLFGE
jgi:hypothetical protein